MFHNRLKSLAILIALLIPSAYVFTQVEHGNTPPPSGMDFINERDVLKTDPGSASAGAGFQNEDSASNDSLNDHRAKIFEFEGDVRVLKNGTGLWLPVQAWMVIREGDKLRTGPGNSIHISYDDMFLNIARIEENTIAEFRNIEPTNLYLSNGTVFNAVDGLKQGDHYQVSTPIAVAAVRGTHFEVTFEAVAQWFSAATIPVPQDMHESAIEVQQIIEDGSIGSTVELPEGRELDFTGGDALGAELVREINPARAARAATWIADMRAPSENAPIVSRGTMEPLSTSKNESGEHAVRKGDNDQYAAQGPGNGGEGGGDGGRANLTAMTVTPPSNLQAPGSSVMGAAMGGFNKDQFVDRMLEMEIAPPVEDMKSLEDYETNGFIQESEPDNLTRKKSQPSMKKMMEFIDLSGTKTADPENREAALAAMHSVMTSMEVPEEKAEHVMETYDSYLDKRESMMNVDETSLTTTSMDSSLESTFSQEFDTSYDNSLAVDSFAGSYEGGGELTGGVEYELEPVMMESESYFEPEPEPEIELDLELEPEEVLDGGVGTETEVDTTGSSADIQTTEDAILNYGGCIGGDEDPSPTT